MQPFLRHNIYKLIHNYDGIDLDVVWETATISISDLKPKIDAILNSEAPEEK